MQIITLTIVSLTVIAFFSIWLSFYFDDKKSSEKSYHLGKSAGIELGKEMGLKARIEFSRKLTAAEQKKVTDWLNENNFVLCYDLNIGGFRVRKATEYFIFEPNE